MGRVSEEELNYMIKLKTTALLREVGNKASSVDLNKDIEKLYTSKTFSYLQDKNSEFCLKSVAELLFLLDKEYQGDWDAWNFQAF